MDKKFQLLVLVLGVFAVISLLIALNLSGQRKQLLERNASISQELDKVSAENSKLSQSLSKLREENKSLNNTLQQSDTQVKAITVERDKNKERLDLTAKERDSLIEKVQNLIEEKKKLQKELEDLKGTQQAKKDDQTSDQSGTPPTGAGQDTYWAQVIQQKAAAELELENVKAQIKEVTFKADELFKERNSLQMELNAVNQTKAELERRASYNEKLVKAISEDLVREKNDKERLLSNLEKIKDDNRYLQSRVKDLEDSKTNLYKKLDIVDQERQGLQTKMRETENVMSERINELVKLKKDISQSQQQISAKTGSQTVELSPIVVRGSQEPGSSALAGSVLSVNKQNSFIIIDMGENAGIKRGDAFEVYRNNKYIARVEVIQVRKDISAADIKEVTPGEEIQATDVARLAK